MTLVFQLVLFSFLLLEFIIDAAHVFQRVLMVLGQFSQDGLGGLAVGTSDQNVVHLFLPAIHTVPRSLESIHRVFRRLRLQKLFSTGDRYIRYRS